MASLACWLVAASAATANVESKARASSFGESCSADTSLPHMRPSDFVHVLSEGFITNREQIRFVRAHAQPRLTEHKFEKLEVRVYGSVAIANGIVVRCARRQGSAAENDIYRVFALRNSRWQAVNAQETLAADERK